MRSSNTNKIRQNTRRGWRFAIAVALALLPLLGVMPSAQADDGAIFEFNPNSGTYTVGSAVPLAISVNGTNVQTVRVNVSYPSRLLNFYGAYTSGSLSPNNSKASCSQNSGNAGSVILGCTLGAARSGDQKVMTLIFGVLAAGDAKVSMVAGDGSTATDILDGNGASVWGHDLPFATYTLVTTKPQSVAGGQTPSQAAPTSSGDSATPTPAPTTPSTHRSPAVKSTDGSITTKVTDSSGAAIEGARVLLDGSRSTYTDADGTASFSSVQTGSHTVSASAVARAGSYDTVTLTDGQKRQLALHLGAMLAPSPIVGYICIVGVIAVVVVTKTRKGNSEPASSVSGAQFAARPVMPGVVVGTGYTPAVVVAPQPLQAVSPAPQMNSAVPMPAGVVYRPGMAPPAAAPRPVGPMQPGARPPVPGQVPPGVQAQGAWPPPVPGFRPPARPIGYYPQMVARPSWPGSQAPPNNPPGATK